jgi:hypothetical protein
VGLINDDMNHTGDATLLRKVNESAVLELIRRCGPVIRSDLARRLHLNLPTITRIANELLNASLIVEASSAVSSGGRRPGLLEFNFRANLIIGVYVAHKMVVAIADLDGGIVADPERIVLGGDSSGYAEMFTRPIRERIEGLVPIMPEIVASALGMGAAVLRAGAIAMSETGDSLFVQPSRA